MSDVSKIEWTDALRSAVGISASLPNGARMTPSNLPALETCTCFAVESGAVFCDCACSYCEEYCLPPEPDFDDEDDCLGCGTCDDCVQRSIDYADEMAADDPTLGIGGRLTNE